MMNQRPNVRLTLEKPVPDQNGPLLMRRVVTDPPRTKKKISGASANPDVHFITKKPQTSEAVEEKFQNIREEVVVGTTARVAKLRESMKKFFREEGQHWVVRPQLKLTIPPLVGEESAGSTE